MTKKIVKTLIALIIIVILLGYNDKLFPARIEITSLAIINVLGIDVIDGKPQLTVVLNEMKQKDSEQNKGGENSSGSSQELLTSTGKTFKQITKKFQTYTDKTIIRRTCKTFSYR